MKYSSKAIRGLPYRNIDVADEDYNDNKIGSQCKDITVLFCIAGISSHVFRYVFCFVFFKNINSFFFNAPKVKDKVLICITGSHVPSYPFYVI